MDELQTFFGYEYNNLDKDVLVKDMFNVKKLNKLKLIGRFLKNDFNEFGRMMNLRVVKARMIIPGEVTSPNGKGFFFINISNKIHDFDGDLLIEGNCYFIKFNDITLSQAGDIRLNPNSIKKVDSRINPKYYELKESYQIPSIQSDLAEANRIKMINSERYIYFKKLFSDGLPGEGKIINRIKGGFIVISNNYECFLPISQLYGIPPNYDSNVGREINFLVVKLSLNASVVISERKYNEMFSK
jgi:hypothetical protein